MNGVQEVVSSNLTAPIKVSMAEKKSSPQPEDKFQERRQYKRIDKNFLLSYFDVQHPDSKVEITQLKNIGMGGMCFVTTKPLGPHQQIRVELNAPYLKSTSSINGSVLASHEKIKNTIYEVRFQFSEVDPKTKYLLGKLIELFLCHERS